MKAKLLCLALSFVFCSVVVAQDATKKKNRRAARNDAAGLVTRQLKDVELTEEQKTKIQAMAKAAAAQMKEIRQAAGLTQEVTKQRAAAMKELRSGGKRGKELMEAANEKAGLNEKQVAAIKKTNEIRNKLLADAVALLTDEQKAKLPKRMQSGKKRGGNAKPKRKKDAA